MNGKRNDDYMKGLYINTYSDDCKTYTSCHIIHWGLCNYI